VADPDETSLIASRRYRPDAYPEESTVPRLTRLARARVAVSAVFAIHGAVAGSFATRIPWIAERLHVDPGALGLALIAPAVGSIATMPLAARLVHRYRGRPLTRILILAWCCSLALPALAPNLPVLFLTLLGFGAAAGMADVAMNAQGVVVEQRYGRSIMSGLHGMWSVGGLVGSAAGALAAHGKVDARLHLAIVAAVLAVLGWLSGWALLNTRGESAAGPDGASVGSAGAGAGAGPGGAGGRPPLFAWPSRAVLLIGLVGFCGVFAEGASGDWSAVYLTNVTGADPGLAALAYTGFALAMTAGRLTGDWVVRRIGSVACVRYGGLTACAGGVLVLVSRAPVPAAAGFALVGVGVAVVVPLVFAAAGRAEANPGHAIAAVATIAYGSGLAAPGIIGGIAHLFSLPVAFGVVTALCLAMALGATALRPHGTRAAAATADVSDATGDTATGDTQRVTTR
jgi:predicted MFS family arabinose efflux permease